MSDNPFIAQQFSCPSFKGNPPRRARGANKISPCRRAKRGRIPSTRGGAPPLAILRFDVTILQQINVNPPQMLTRCGRSKCYRALEVNPVSAKPLLVAARDAERL
jgi:hypothetical protein